MKHTRAFSLLELSVSLVLAGLIAGFALKFFEATGRTECYTTTKAQLVEIQDAIERFAMTNDRFPLPARRNVDINSKDYGKEVAFNNTDINTHLDRVNLPGGVQAIFGALPTTTLGLGMDKSYDCWGNKFTYVVTKDLADPAKDASQKTKFLYNSTAGAVRIQLNNSSTILADAGYAIISHGEDGLGAIKANDGGTDKRWCDYNPPPNPVPLSEQNCETRNNVIISAPFNNNKANALTYFDDIVAYRGKPWRAGPVPINGVCNNIDTAGGSCSSGTVDNYATSSVCETYQATWKCVGANGGSTDNNCHSASVNGACYVAPTCQLNWDWSPLPPCMTTSPAPCPSNLAWVNGGMMICADLPPPCQTTAGGPLPLCPYMSPGDPYFESACGGLYAMSGGWWNVRWKYGPNGGNCDHL